MRLRRGTGGHIVNAIVTGFKMGAAVRVDGNTSIGLVNDGGLKGEGIYVYGNGKETCRRSRRWPRGFRRHRRRTAAAIAKWFTSGRRGPRHHLDRAPTRCRCQPAPWTFLRT